MKEAQGLDWKIFGQLHPVAVERFCERVLIEIVQINTDDARRFHQRYLDIFEVIKRRDKEIAQLFNDPRRSNALSMLAGIRSRGLLTDEEFSRFSPETRGIIEELRGP